MSLPFPRSRGRGLVLKECNFYRPAIAFASLPGSSSASAVIAERAYWEMDFPAQGEEVWGDNPSALVDEFERLLLQAVEERLRADVPVGSYLSGGVDSSMILALACRLKGPAINTYTVRVNEPEFDELSAASLSARHIGAKPPIVQDYGDRRSARELSRTDRGGRGAGDRYRLRRTCSNSPSASMRTARKSSSPARARTNGWSVIRGTRRPS